MLTRKKEAKNSGREFSVSKTLLATRQQESLYQVRNRYCKRSVTISPIERTVFAAYFHPTKRFYWLVAEADDAKEYVTGYFAGHEVEGWGRLHLDGIRTHGAVQIFPWKPCSFPEAVDRVRQHIREQPN